MAGHDLLVRLLHRVRVSHLGMDLLVLAIHLLVHVERDNTHLLLLMGNWAILVGQKHGLEGNDFLAELADLSGKLVILGGVHLDLGLQVLEPLLLALTALEGGDTGVSGILAMCSSG